MDSEQYSCIREGKPKQEANREEENGGHTLKSGGSFSEKTVSVNKLSGCLKTNIICNFSIFQRVKRKEILHHHQ